MTNASEAWFADGLFVAWLYPNHIKNKRSKENYYDRF